MKVSEYLKSKFFYRIIFLVKCIFYIEYFLVKVDLNIFTTSANSFDIFWEINFWNIRLRPGTM